MIPLKKLFRLGEFLLIILVIVGGYMRFVKLNWGEGYFFHPDERNIAGAVAQLKFPSQMNPHFFAYGSFPIYLYFFLTKLLTKGDVYTNSIMVGRGISAILSTLIIFQTYLLGRRWGERVGLVSAILTTFTVGLIQYAHYSTVEVLLGWFYLSAFWLLVKHLDTGSLRWLVGAAFLIGLSLATKVTSGLIVPIATMAVWFGKRRIWKEGLLGLVMVGIMLLVFPFLVLDWQGFLGGMRYESNVATGKLAVFYTKQYQGSMPILWHFGNVLPWSLGLLVTAILPLAWVVAAKKMLRDKPTFWLWAFVTIFFFWHTILYVKWIRYLIPILPFMVLLIAIMCDWLLERKNRLAQSYMGLMVGVVIAGSVWQSARFMGVYLKKDTRVAIGEWAEKHVNPNERVLAEIYDLGVVAMPEATKIRTDLFNFYDLDVDRQEERLNELTGELETSDWILVPSRRIYGNVLNQSHKYPLAAGYYQTLFDGRLGFEKQADFGINTFLDEQAEETYQVFDHPRAMLFRKVKQFTRGDYSDLIKSSLETD